jgi:8-oxo-dGTP diphosphatase
MIINFHELDKKVDLQFSVIVTKDQKGFVYVKHQNRNTWEIPGGHIEAGESALDAANRELIEETAAKDYTIQEVCLYSVTIEDRTTYGGLFYAEISSYHSSLEFEISEVQSFEHIPTDLTYPKIQPLLLNKVVSVLFNELNLSN